MSDLRNAPDLPLWIQKLRERYMQTDTGQFILHGNVHDLVQCDGQLYSVPEFLDAFFSLSGKAIVHYDPGRGIYFPNEDQAVRAASALCQSGMVPQSKIAPQGFEKTPKALIVRAVEHELSNVRSPEVALEVLESLLLCPSITCAIIVHYAELVAPDGDIATLEFAERTAAARFHRWSLSREIVRGGNLIMLLTSSLSDLSRLVTRNPRIAEFNLPLPGALERARFLAHIQPSLDPERGERLTRETAGLQLRQIQDLVVPAQTAQNSSAQNARDFFNTPSELPSKAIAERKKEILEQECAGLIEVIHPNHGFAEVGGMEQIKERLNQVTAHMRAGHRAQVPMGILMVGPMGTGKTFLAEAFAKESGLAAIKLKNFRDKWVGSTEANLEKILSVIDGLGEILVIIDEGDRSIGGTDGDSGVQSRVMARLKEFMSDTSHRGRIIFVMMTNRPDKLDTDMKRPGRFDLKIPFFHPCNASERLLIFRSVMARHHIEAPLPDDELLTLLDPLDGYAAADLEAIALMAYDDYQSGRIPEGLTERPSQITSEYLAQAIDDFMPTRELEMINYMELLAVQEASSRRLLPERFRNIDVHDLNQRLAQARAALKL